VDTVSFARTLQASLENLPRENSPLSPPPIIEEPCKCRPGSQSSLCVICDEFAVNLASPSVFNQCDYSRASVAQVRCSIVLLIFRGLIVSRFLLPEDADFKLFDCN